MNAVTEFWIISRYYFRLEICKKQNHVSSVYFSDIDNVGVSVAAARTHRIRPNSFAPRFGKIGKIIGQSRIKMTRETVLRLRRGCYTNTDKLIIFNDTIVFQYQSHMFSSRKGIMSCRQAIPEKAKTHHHFRSQKKKSFILVNCQPFGFLSSTERFVLCVLSGLVSVYICENKKKLSLNESNDFYFSLILLSSLTCLFIYLIYSFDKVEGKETTVVDRFANLRRWKILIYCPPDLLLEMFFYFSTNNSSEFFLVDTSNFVSC